MHSPENNGDGQFAFQLGGDGEGVGKFRGCGREADESASLNNFEYFCNIKALGLTV